MKTRPSNNHRLGIWFPRDKKRPQLVWAAFAVEGNYHFPVFDSFLGQLNCVSWTLRFWENKRRGCTSDHPLTIYYRDYDEITNKSVYHCVEACQGVTVPSNLTGEYVVMNGEPRGPIEAFGDMTLADFRHVMDFWSTYYDDTIRDTKNGASILAVKVNCPLEKALFSRDTFSLVAVSYSYPSLQRQVSVLSQVLGDALEILELSRDELEQRAKLLDHHPENAWHNAVAELMMTDIDPASDTWAQTPQKRLFSGSVLILRKDGTDLDVKSVQYMYDYCYEVLRPLFARSLAREMTPDAVLDHITTEKMIAWKPEEAPSRDKEGKPQRGTVAPIFSTYEERD